MLASGPLTELTRQRQQGHAKIGQAGRRRRCERVAWIHGYDAFALA
jgi:hypothetical protein